MSEFLTRIAADGGKPIAREVTILGETGTVYFRLLNAAERLQLIGSRPISVTKGQEPTVTIDLAENEATKHKLVHFSVCDEQGKRVYKDVAQVRGLPAAMIDALATVAERVNEEALGKAGSEPGES